MANGKIKRKQINEKLKQQEKRTQEAYAISEQKRAEYHQKLKPLKEVKEKYLHSLFEIQGINSVGLRVYDENIVLYAEKITEELKERIPKELDGYPVILQQRKITPATYTDWTTADYYNDQYKRPLSPGRGMGHYAVTVGTLGSWWKSKALNRIVGITNNHVATAEDRAKARRNVVSTIPCTVLPGVNTSIQTPKADDRQIVIRIDKEQRDSTIDSISPTSFMVGDLITITGKSLNFRKGYSKVYFNGIEAVVNAWDATGTQDTSSYTFDVKKPFYTDVVTTIKAYAPPGLSVGDQVIITLELEGDPLVSPGRRDGGSFNNTTATDLLKDQIGMLDKSIPLANAKVDVASFIPYNDSMVTNKIYTRPGVYDRNRVGTDGGDKFPWRKDIDYYQPTGFAKAEDLIEGMAMIKTGRSTGTTCFQILDANVTEPINYPTASYQFVDIIHYAPYTFNGATRTTYSDFTPTYGGDSGSSIFTCPPEWYHQYFDYYSTQLGYCDYPQNTIFSQDKFAFVGNLFAYGDDYSVFSDKYSNWAATMALDLAPLAFEISADGKTFSDGSAAIDKTWYFRANGRTTSSGNADIMQISYMDMEDIALEPYTVETDVNNLNFSAEAMTLQLRGHASSVSSGSATIRIIVPTMVMIASGNSTSSGKATIKLGLALKGNGLSTSTGSAAVRIITPLVFTANGNSQSSGSGTVRIVASNQTIVLSANGASSSSGNVAVRIIAPFRFSASATSISSGNATLRIIAVIQLKGNAVCTSSGSANILLLPVNWKPSSQYEDIYFEITRSIDLNLAV